MLATAPRVFTFLTKSILFLCCHMDFHHIIYLDDILVLLHSRHVDKRAQSILCLELVHHELYIFQV